MNMPKDRAEAGQALGRKLSKYRDLNTLVLAIPQGGVEIGHHLAKSLGSDLLPIISKRLPDPFEPGTGFGAVAEEGCLVIDRDIYKWLSTGEIRSIKREQSRAIKKWVQDFRMGRPLPGVQDKIIILVDDGMATGFTMKAAIAVCRKKRADKIVVAVASANENAAREIDRLAEEAVILDVLDSSRPGSELYAQWPEVLPERVREILRSWELQK